ncbi:hypothetical protein JZO70_20860 [Enterococcus sp. 669A]|uniref:Uncharacterized protein n=1 Tax=Candidatus Enterococcus moelleringii TaxID=2815325 RepID=A0ABS3LG80_9ENTE|nr:hypothetical protein [Enterococcus sp. 669A]MBO1308638.1 hypothetical protein [Enterococcus sp. 669A]
MKEQPRTASIYDPFVLRYLTLQKKINRKVIFLYDFKEYKTLKEILLLAEKVKELME